MDWLVPFLIMIVFAVVYLAIQRNSPSNRQARNAIEALARAGAFWDSAPADLRERILTRPGVSSIPSRDIPNMIVRPWTALGAVLQSEIGKVILDAEIRAWQEVNAEFSSRFSRDNAQEQPQRSTDAATHLEVLSTSGDSKPNAVSVIVKPDQAQESVPYSAAYHSDPPKGIDPNLLKRAEEGDANAQGIIALLYSLGGNGVPRDDTQAAHWFRAAAERGHVLAQFHLAGLYQRGSGVSQDHERAMFWYRKAAEQGHANAQLNLAVGYFKGLGAKQDYTEAARWMLKAAEQGDATAQYDLGFIYAKGQGVPRDYAKAAAWFHKAAAQGYVAAYSFLGAQYAEGVGVLQSPSEAFFWSSVAAAIGKESEREQATKTRDLAAACLNPEESSALLKRVMEWIQAHPPKT